MDKDFKVTIDGRPAYALMMKYRIENEARKLGNKFMNDVLPKIDEFLMREGTR